MTRIAAAACTFLLFGATVAQAGVKDGVNRALGQFNRDLCRSFPLQGCAPPPAKSQRPASPAAPGAGQAAKPQQAPPPKPEANPAVEQAAKRDKQPVASRAEPQEAPVPRQKPKPPAIAGTAAAELGETPVIPVPRAKPVAPSGKASPPPSGPSEMADNGRAAAVAPILPAPHSVTAPQPATDIDCQMRLDRLGLAFTPKPTFASSGNCTLTDPVVLSSLNLDDGKVVFPDQPVLNCSFAETFAKWVKEKGDPAVRREAKSGLSVIYTGPGYECRGRNGDGSAKLSEHGYGNAVDITLFKLKDGRTFQVADALNPVSPAFATLKSMRFTACESFSTVLGPGANSAHAEHFHFDNGRHGKTGTYRICE